MTHDAFARLAIALRAAALEGQLSEQTNAADTRRVRNVLLDACGSDHRPLVELLMAVADDVRPMLVAERTAQAVWESRRAPIVHRLVATRYLQQDMARWAIDVWAYADGVREVIPEAPALPVVMSSHADANTLANTAARASTVPSAVQPGWARAKASARGTPAAAFTTPATAPSRRSGAPVKTWGWRSARAPMSAAELARIQRMERVSYTVLIAAVLIGFFAEGYALMSRPVERGTTAAVASSVPATEPVSAAPAPVSAAPALAAATPDTAAVAQNSPPMVFGRGWLGPVAGTYQVAHTTRSVEGGDGCDLVLNALARQQTTIEHIEHDEASATLRWRDRDIRGRVDADGRFVTGPDSGYTNGVRWTFTMAGRFSRTGFSAEAIKTTSAVLGWHKSRSCAVIADLTGTRLATAAGAP